MLEFLSAVTFHVIEKYNFMSELKIQWSEGPVVKCRVLNYPGAFYYFCIKNEFYGTQLYFSCPGNHI
jgi:hypothetical protein